MKLACRVIVGLGLFVAATPARAEVHFEYDNIAFRAGRGYSFPVPGNLRDVYYSFSGRGRSAVRVSACHVPASINDNDRAMHSADLGGTQTYPKQIRSFLRDQRPDLQGCDWGLFVACFDQEGCSGAITVWWETWDGASTRGTSEPPGHPGESPSGEAVPVPPGTTEPPAGVPGGDGTDLGDAGTYNNDAALVGYGCRIDGALRQGDYDNFTFFFTGGPLRISSASRLDLVADLLDWNGRRVARSGVDTPQFDIQGEYPPGRYYLQVRVMYHGGEGPYQVFLGPDAGCRLIDRP